MRIRALPWITQALSSELDLPLPPEVELRQTLKPNSCRFLGAACAAVACRIANSLTENCAIPSCLAASCLTASYLALVSICPGTFAKSLDRGVDSKKSQTMATVSGNTASHTLKMAKFHTARREFKEAIVLWAKLAESKPDAFAEANLGWSYLQLGEKQKAQEHINRSIQLNPRTIEGYRYLGYFLMGEGKVPEAVKAFHTSMSFDPHHKCHCGDLEKLVLSKSKHRKP